MRFEVIRSRNGRTTIWSRFAERWQAEQAVAREADADLRIRELVPVLSLRPGDVTENGIVSSVDSDGSGLATVVFTDAVMACSADHMVALVPEDES